MSGGDEGAEGADLAGLLDGMLGGGGGAGGGLGNLLRQAQELTGQLQAAQEDAAAQEVVGTAGGGVVRVTVSGALEFRKVEISPEAVDPTDVGMLEDLVLAAIHDATAKARGLTEGLLGGAGGLLGAADPDQ